MNSTSILSTVLVLLLLAGSHQLFAQNRLRAPESRFELGRGGELKIPYPIIYVHGLVGSSASWGEMSDWMGVALGNPVELEFSLNADGALNTSEAAEDIESFIPNGLASANQYVMNFNCNSSGSCATTGSLQQSNQSGIYKQAEAIGIAIAEVLNATGVEKVILLGHSMGGVACREYLQNAAHWQTNSHRVAKLVTSGSPHVGFDLGSKLLKIPGLFQGIDTDGEAIRDLKNQHTGFLSSVPGVFFWGGEEDQEYMYDDIFYWWNVDVNCNGYTNEIVTGLNQCDMYADLEFASIYDTYDLIVSSASAGYNYIGETTGGEDLCSVLDKGWSGTFSCESWGWDVPSGGSLTGGHNELTEQVIETLWALDEADDYDKSFDISFNQWYTGFITPQASVSDGYDGYQGSYATDWDDYVISVPSGGGELTISAEFSDVSLGCDLLLYKVSTSEYIDFVQNVGNSEVMVTNVAGGQYIVEFNGEVSASEAFGQYWFSVTLDPTNSIAASDALNLISVGPNPASNELWLTLNNSAASTAEIQLTDLSGKIVFRDSNLTPTRLDVSSLARGVYILSVQVNGTYQTEIVALR